MFSFLSRAGTIPRRQRIKLIVLYCFVTKSGLFARISRCFSTFIPESSGKNSVSEPFERLNYAASACCRSINLSASSTAFAVWMPKKMYRISVSFLLALIRRIE